jgi:hypothetical protein
MKCSQTKKIYQFKNKIKNLQIWPRSFVAISLSSAIGMAREWEQEMNKANDNVPHLLFTFDYENVNIVDTDIEDEGYLE